jgi:hypothetical protein
MRDQHDSGTNPGNGWACPDPICTKAPFDGRWQHASTATAIAEAQDLADANGCPCGVWGRDGWYVACEVAPELIEPDPEPLGWSLDAVVDPTEVRDAEPLSCRLCGRPAAVSDDGETEGLCAAHKAELAEVLLDGALGL